MAARRWAKDGEKKTILSTQMHELKVYKHKQQSAGSAVPPYNQCAVY